MGEEIDPWTSSHSPNQTSASDRSAIAPMLNFTTFISTNMKIIFVGDSITSHHQRKGSGCNQPLKELGSAQTVIIKTLQLSNNVKTHQDWNVRDIVATWQPTSDGGGQVQHMLVQEFGSITNQILWMNGQNLGYNISMPDFA
eukprot:scaffold931_cov200-Alexandrium_tamarense.AAC.4